MAVALAAVPVEIVEAHSLLTAVHEHAVVVLNPSVVAPSRQAVAVDGLAHDCDVVDGSRSDRLPIRVLGPVGLKAVVANAGPLACVQAKALDDQAELGLAAPALVHVEAVVANVPDTEVLQVDRAAPDLNAVVDVVHDLDVVDVGTATKSTKGESVQLIRQGDHLAAVAQGEVGDAATVVVIVAAAIEHVGVAGEGLGQTLHSGEVTSARGRNVARGCVLGDVGVPHDRKVAPLVSRLAPDARLGVATGPGGHIGLGGHDDRRALRAIDEDLRTLRHSQAAAEITCDQGARLDGQSRSGQDKDLALEVIGVAVRPGSGRGDVGRDEDFGSRTCSDESERDETGGGKALDEILHWKSSR